MESSLVSSMKKLALPLRRRDGEMRGQGDRVTISLDIAYVFMYVKY
jgi:hypothetical protein